MWINDMLWMWDIPQERKIQKWLARKAYGNVLVAGYGFGLLPKYLAKNPKVKQITVVESSKEVIKYCQKIGKIYGKVVIGDFYKLAENKKFDCVIGDIWPDVTPNFLGDYIRFKRKAERLVKKRGRVLAWDQDFFEYLLTKRSLRKSHKVKVRS